MYEMYIFKRSEIYNLHYEYLVDEEIAFKNAILLHSKKFYQVSYKINQKDK